MSTKRAALTSLAVAALVAWSQAPASAQSPELDAIRKHEPALRAFSPQQPKRVQLANGMLILLQEDHELPIVSGYALIRGGSREEPAAKTGLVQVFGQAWRTGGTQASPGDKLDDFLEARAAKVETWGGFDSTGISWNSLKDSFDDTFKAVVELLRHEPVFPPDKIELAKTRLNTQIARRNDDADGIAGREARSLAYGKDSPYGRIAEYATVAAISRDDLVRWHRQYVVPNNIVMAVWGDFDAARMQARLQQAFGSWPKGQPAKAVVAAFPGPKPGLYFVAKDDVTQSKIRLVHLGTRRDTPDYYALEVMNQVFGGGFSSRLFTNVRSKKGLSYYVFGDVGTQYDHPGLFIAGLATKNETTAAGIAAMLEEIDLLQQAPPTADELAKAKDAIQNSFVFRIDSKEKILHEKVADVFHGYPPDLLERYQAGIAKVTADDVLRAARKYIDKSKLAVLVVGKASAFDKPLASIGLGPVTTIDVTIPALGPKPAAVTQSDEAGRALLARVASALGGAEKVKGVKALRARGTLVAETPQGSVSIGFERTQLLPNRLAVVLQTPMGRMTQVLTPEVAFMSASGRSQDLPASMRDEYVGALESDPLTVVPRAGDPKVVVTAKGKEQVGEVQGDVLLVSVDGKSVRWVVDPKTGNVIRTARMATGPTGPAEEVTDLSDFRPVDGIPLAHKVVMTRGGKTAEQVSVESLELNPVVDPMLFEKPSAPSAGGDKPAPPAAGKPAAAPAAADRPAEPKP